MNNLLALIDCTRRMSLKAQYEALILAKQHFREGSEDMKYLLRQIKLLQTKRLKQGK